MCVSSHKDHVVGSRRPLPFVVRSVCVSSCRVSSFSIGCLLLCRLWLRGASLAGGSYSRSRWRFEGCLQSRAQRRPCTHGRATCHASRRAAGEDVFHIFIHTSLTTPPGDASCVPTDRARASCGLAASRPRAASAGGGGSGRYRGLCSIDDRPIKAGLLGRGGIMVGRSRRELR